MKRLIKSYPQCIKRIIDYWCSRNNEIPQQPLYDWFVFEILRKTPLDAVVLDYNITWPIPQDLNRNIHKPFALEMEKRLAKYKVIDVQHAKHFSIYRLNPDLKRQKSEDAIIQKKIFYLALGNIMSDAPHKEFTDFHAVFLDKGFSGRESWGVWANEKDAVFYLKLPPRETENIRLKFQIRPFYGMKYANIYQEGRLVHTWKFDSPRFSNYFLDIKVPLNRDIVQLRFEQFDLCRACNCIKDSKDTRTLGIGFFTVDVLDMGKDNIEVKK